MTEEIIDLNQYTEEKPKTWRRRMIRKEIKRAKEKGLSQNQTVVSHNKKMPAKYNINEEINLSRVKYYWDKKR